MNPQIQNQNGTKTELKQISNDTKFSHQVEYDQDGNLLILEPKQANLRDWEERQRPIGGGGNTKAGEDQIRWVMNQVLNHAMRSK